MFLAPKDHNRAMHMLLSIHELFNTFNYLCSVSVVRLIISHKVSYRFLGRDKQFYSHKGMVSTTGSTSCKLGKFPVFCCTSSNNDWGEGPKWQTWFMASWWMDCKDGDLDFACDPYVLPSQCCHHSLWLVFLP